MKKNSLYSSVLLFSWFMAITGVCFSQTPVTANNIEKDSILCFGYIPPKQVSGTNTDRDPAVVSKLFSATGSDNNEDVYLYRYVVTLLKEMDDTRWLKQRDGKTCLRAYEQGNVGSCVGNATALCIAIRAAYEIVVQEEAESFVGMGAADGMYGLAREYSGLLGQSGEGATGSGAAGAVNKLGSLWSIKYDVADLSSYIDTRARTFGIKGVGDDLKKEAALHLFAQTIRITSTDEAWTCIGKGIPLNICSTVGFNSKRDKNGMCAPSGSWAHSMAVIARRTRDSNREFLVQNSWGDDWNQGSYVDDMPFGSFWISEQALKLIIRQGDTYGYLGLNGFEEKIKPNIINGVLVWLWVD